MSQSLVFGITTDLKIPFSALQLNRSLNCSLHRFEPIAALVLRLARMAVQVFEMMQNYLICFPEFHFNC